MTLRTRTVLVVGSALLGLYVLLYVTANQILLAGFARLEAQAVRENVQRVQDALAEDLERLNSTALDYAAWDDTYAFAAGDNPTFPEVNLTEQTFANLGLNVLVIVNQSGEMLYGGGLDTATGLSQPLPAELTGQLTPSSRLLQHRAETDSLTGLLMVGANPLLLASRPILASDYTGPILGTLIMGRYLDAAAVARLAQVTHLSLLIVSPADPTAPGDMLTAEAALSPAAPIAVQPLPENVVAGYTRLYDLDGQPVLLLRVDAPRSIYAEGQKTVLFFLLALLVVGLGFGALIWLQLERLVLSRLGHLSRSVQAIGVQGDAAARVPVTGHDELSDVATAINGMLAAQAQANAATRASEAQFRTLAETSAAAIFIAQEGQVRYANSRAEALTGYTHEELLSLPIQGTMPGAALLGPTAAAPLGAADDGAQQFEVKVSGPHGPERWLEVTAGAIAYNGAPATIATAYDITERKQAEDGLRAANAQLTTLVTQLEQRNREGGLLSQMSDLLQACPTAAESYVVISQFLPRLLPAPTVVLYLYHASRDKLEVAASAGFVPAGQPERTFAPNDCWALRLGRPHSQAGPAAGLDCLHFAAAPRGRYLCVPITAQGDALGVLHLRLDAGDEAATPDAPAVALAEWERLTASVAERLALSLANVNLREALRHQAVRDPLTGLFNRRYMQETLDRELRRAARSQHALAVVFLDIDHFKQFNDTHGHAGGDALLLELGLLLRSCLRAEDIACRYGGEEFLLIMPDTSLEVARQRAEKVWSQVAALRVQHYDQLLGAVTLSLGVAAYPQHGVTGDLLIKAADEALYRAKQAGRNRVCVAEG